MSEYYNGDPVQPTLDKELDLTDATNLYIKYQVNNSTGAKITAEKSGSTSVVATVPKAITEVGMLYYQPYVSWDSGTTYYHGDKKSITINKKIEVA